MAGRWGWRPLVLSLFISVFVVACNVIQPTPSVSTATHALNVTLTLRHPRGPTANVASQTPVAPVVASSDDATPAAPTLAFEGLRCYQMATGQSMCLGSVRNLLDTPVEQIAITMRVLDAQTRARQQTIWLEQALLPPGESAPYRVLWANGLQAEDRVNVSLARAQRTTDTRRYADVRVLSSQGEMHNGRYSLSALIANGDTVDALDVRAVLMLRAPDGGVSGYRVTQVSERLLPGAQLTVNIALIPQQPRDDLRPSLHVEALRAVVGQ